MAQAQVQPSGSEVSKVESDILQTVTLADTIVTLIREPISLIYQNVTKTKELKRSLGVWQQEALEDDNWCRIPVLRLKELENYLVDLDGVIPAASQNHYKRNSSGNRGFRLLWTAWQRPSPSPAPKHEMPSSGTACWAYFLFALGIRPGNDIIGWKPSTDGFISTQNGGMEMEIEGSALCHIINLYSLITDFLDAYAHKFIKLTDRRKTQTCDFPFGNLAWMTVNNQLHAHFTPGLETELAATKMPFGKRGHLMNPDTIMASYLTSVYHGISDSRYRLAPANALLPERIDRLITCFEMLRNRAEAIRNDVLLISYEWFEEAARVKRRVLAQGGEDHSFFEDVCCHAKACGLPSMATVARNHFFLDRETFRFFVEGQKVDSMPKGHWPLDLVSIIGEVLGSYETELEGSWKRSLFDMKDDVLKVAKIPNEFMIRGSSGVRLMEFTTGCDLWHQKGLLGAPIHTS